MHVAWELIKNNVLDGKCAILSFFCEKKIKNEALTHFRVKVSVKKTKKELKTNFLFFNIRGTGVKKGTGKLDMFVNKFHNAI